MSSFGELAKLLPWNRFGPPNCISSTTWAAIHWFLLAGESSRQFISLMYSSVPNTRVGWNNHVGRKINTKLINVLDGINMLVGKPWKYDKYVCSKKIGDLTYVLLSEFRKFKLAYFIFKSFKKVWNKLIDSGKFADNCMKLFKLFQINVMVGKICKT